MGAMGAMGAMRTMRAVASRVPSVPCAVDESIVLARNRVGDDGFMLRQEGSSTLLHRRQDRLGCFLFIVRHVSVP